MGIENFVFTGMNGNVLAIDRRNGQIAWQWQSPRPRRAFVSIFLDGDRVLVGLNGYLYCLDAASGRALWENPLKGFGHGNFSFASVRGGQMPVYAAAQQEQEEEEARRAATTHTTT